jgi:hypothetical protein
MFTIGRLGAVTFPTNCDATTTMLFLRHNMLDRLAHWVAENREWIFSGIGVASIGVVVHVLRRLFPGISVPPTGNDQTLTSGALSQNVQAARDVHIGTLAAGPHAQAPDPRAAHDRDLFRRYDALLPEQRLRDELDEPLYNHRTDTIFRSRLSDYLALARRTEGEFSTPEVQDSFHTFAVKLSELQRFIAVHFFDRLESRPDEDGQSRLYLYPDLRHHHDDDEARAYDEHANALLLLLDEVANTFVTFRRSIKHSLMI